jgi:hypothetical protein
VLLTGGEPLLGLSTLRGLALVSRPAQEGRVDSSDEISGNCSWIMTIIHHSCEMRCGTACCEPTGASVFDVVLVRRGATPLTWKQWQTTDAKELGRGAETGRLCVKFADTAEMLATAR